MRRQLVARAVVYADVRRVWNGSVSSWILHYYKPWKGVRDKSGTLAKCIWAEGNRFSKPKMQVVA